MKTFIREVVVYPEPHICECTRVVKPVKTSRGPFYAVLYRNWHLEVNHSAPCSAGTARSLIQTACGKPAHQSENPNMEEFRYFLNLENASCHLNEMFYPDEKLC